MAVRARQRLKAVGSAEKRYVNVTGGPWGAETFGTVAAELSLSAADATALRRIALASERAVLLGRYIGPYDSVMVPFPPGDHQHADFVAPSATWFRDYATNAQAILHVMSWLVKNGKEDEACAEKAEAVALFESMLDEVAAMGFEQYQGPQRLRLRAPPF